MFGSLLLAKPMMLCMLIEESSSPAVKEIIVRAYNETLTNENRPVVIDKRHSECERDGDKTSIVNSIVGSRTFLIASQTGHWISTMDPVSLVPLSLSGGNYND